jgi:hypothetical protein
MKAQQDELFYALLELEAYLEERERQLLLLKKAEEELGEVLIRPEFEEKK